MQPLISIEISECSPPPWDHTFICLLHLYFRSYYWQKENGFPVNIARKEHEFPVQKPRHHLLICFSVFSPFCVFFHFLSSPFFLPFFPLLVALALWHHLSSIFYFFIMWFSFFKVSEWFLVLDVCAWINCIAKASSRYAWWGETIMLMYNTKI